MGPSPAQQRAVLEEQQQLEQPQQRAITERTRLLADGAPAADSSDSSGSSHSTSSSRHALESALPADAAAAAASSRRNAIDKENARWMRLTILLCILFLSAGLATYLDAKQLELLIESLRDAPLLSMLVFTVLFGAAVVLLVPGMLLSIGSGAAFGLMAGCVVAWLGTVLGQIGAFLLGRYLLRDVVVNYLEKHVSHFSSVDASISEDGWRLVVLLRLSPVLPYNLM
jgi:membrane protein DedA with SNARE-associated domain